MRLIASWGLLSWIVAAPAGAAPLPHCPPGWKVEVVAEAPKVKHPSVVCCAPDGRVFVAEDPMDMGTDNSGNPVDRILCFHPDGRVMVFAEGLHAVFGLAYLDGKVYVHHCPKFSVFTDADGVGRDRKDLISQTNPKPGPGFNDHIPSNVRLGMDGWLYVSVGDKGIYGAVGTDGSQAELRGGGILRLRPDGAHLEVFSTGTRNHLDVAIDSEDEIFTYDNTDDGNGWWTRVTHMADGGFYGYPWDYKPRRPYTLWMMADYGGGSPTGALAYNEDALPQKYRGNLFLCEWGRKQILRLTVERDGGTYKIWEREDFLTDGGSEFRPVGIAVSPDGLSLYVTDWGFGGWKQGVTTGRLLKVTYAEKSQAAPKPEWFIPAATGKPFTATTDELVSGLKHPAQAVRLVAQRRLADQGVVAVPAVSNLLADGKAPSFARWSAIWTLDAIDRGAAGRAAIIAALADADPSVRRQAARQLGTRGAREAVPNLIQRLSDEDPSVRFQAATALGRVGDKAAVAPLTRALPQTDLYARYAAFTALNRIGRADSSAWSEVVSALSDATPAVREGAGFALRETFDEALATPLRDFAADAKNSASSRAAALTILAGMSHKPAPWKGDWWGTQPVKTPRPANTQEWGGTEIAAGAVRAGLAALDPTVQAAAVEAVAVIRRPELAADLATVFAGTTDLDLKRAVLRSLGATKARETGADLVAGVLLDPAGNPALLIDAVAAAGQIGGPKLTEALTRFVAAPVAAEPVAAALDVLGELKAADAVPAVAKHLTHTDARVRDAAVRALAGIGGKPAMAALLPLLADKAPAVRRAAVGALAAVRDRSAVDALLTAYADPETRAEAITALAAIPDLRAIDVYLDGLAGRSAAAREACRGAVAAIQTEALPRIEARLEESPPLAASVVADLQRVYAAPIPIRGWRVLGPFPREAAPPFDPAAPAFEKEHTDSTGKPASWKSVRGDRTGKVDLRRQGFSALDNVSAFAVAEVEGGGKEVVITAGCDDGLVVWVNGTKVFDRPGNGGYKADSLQFRAKLQAGKNVLVAQITQGGGAWEFAISVPPPGTGRLFRESGKDVDLAEYARFAAKETGDPGRGRAVFVDPKGAGCAKCHVTGSLGAGGGGDVGPSLAGVGAKYNRQQLIDAVLYPSKQILDGYHQTVVVTSEGQVKLGIVRAETADELTLVDANGKREVLKKEDLDERKESGKSLMPDGLHTGLSPNEFVDLIAFLESLKQPTPDKKALP